MSQNLVLYSANMSNVWWTANSIGVVATGDLAGAPDGTSTATSYAFAVTTSFIYAKTADVALKAGAWYTFSAWVWTNTGKATIGLRIADSASVAVTTSVTLTSTPTRVSVSFKATVSGSPSYCAGFENRVGLGGDGIAGTVIVWGSQVVQANWVGDYCSTVAAAVGLLTPPPNMASEGGQNILLRSSAFNVSPWSVSNLTTSANQYANPIDGAVTAFSLVGAADVGVITHYLQQSFVCVVKSKVTFSVYAKADTLTQLFLYGDLLGAVVNIGFDLTTGLAISSVGSVTGVCSAVVGATGWYRCSITFSPTVTTGMVRCYAGKLGSATYKGTVADKVAVYGSQLVQCNQPGTYVPTTTATVGADSPPYLVASEGGQNLLLQSEDLSTSWSVTRSSVVTNQIANPITGALTVDVFSDDTGVSALHYITPTAAPVLKVGVVYTLSALVKANGGQWLELAPNGANTICWLDVLNGVVGAKSTDVLNATITAVPGAAGWYWCTTTFRQVASSVYFVTGNAAANNVYASTSAVKFYLTDMQLVQVNWQGDRCPTTTVAIGSTTPPVNITPGGQNLLVQSARLDLSPWIPFQATALGGQAAHPITGAMTAALVTDAAGASTYHSITQTLSPNRAQGIYTISVLVKAGPTLRWIALSIQAPGTTGYFDILNGVTGSKTALVLSSSIRALAGNPGWYICSVTVKQAIVNVALYPASSDGVVAYGVPVGYSFYVSDTRLEEGFGSVDWLSTGTTAISKGAVQRAI